MVFVLTYVPEFFRELGFRIADKSEAASQGLGRLREVREVPGLRRGGDDLGKTGESVNG